jgi:hypothetical protein
MFNVPNHLSPFVIGSTTSAQLGASNADGTYQPSTFGQVTSTTDPRTMEFVLRVHF